MSTYCPFLSVPPLPELRSNAILYVNLVWLWFWHVVGRAWVVLWWVCLHTTAVSRPMLHTKTYQRPATTL